MAGTIFSEWAVAWKNNAHRSVEFNTLSVNTALGTIGQETGMIDIPNLGGPIFGLRLRLEGALNCTAGGQTFLTNIIGGAFDIRIYKPDGRPLIYLAGNGTRRVMGSATAGVANQAGGIGSVNDILIPGDVTVFTELFNGKLNAQQDRLSGMTTIAGTQDGTIDILIPVYIPADAGTHKLQLRNSSFTWGVGAAGTVHGGNVDTIGSVFTLELIEEMLPLGATMSYFGVTNPQTIGLVVGDNYLGQYLNRGAILKAIVIQSPLPRNLGDIRLTHENVSIIDTEFEDIVSLTALQFDTAYQTMLMVAQSWIVAGAILYSAGGRNVAVLQPGDLQVTDATNLHMSLATAGQNLRLMQIQYMDLPRAATRPEVQSTQAAPSSPVIAVQGNPNNQRPAASQGTLLGKIFNRPNQA